MERLGEASDAGVVNQDVEASVGGIDPGGGVFELVQDGHVAGNDLDFSSGIEDGAGGGVESGLRASAEDGGGAECGEAAGDGGADASSGSSDYGDLPGQRLPGVHRLEAPTSGFE